MVVTKLVDKSQWDFKLLDWHFYISLTIFVYYEPTLQTLNPKNNVFTQVVELMEHCSSL
jgi:hypothetical protein